MNREKVAEFAQQFGFDGARYRGAWEHYNVYEPITKSEGPADIGKPEFILEHGGIIRMATEDEVFKYIDSLPEDE